MRLSPETAPLQPFSRVFPTRLQQGAEFDLDNESLSRLAQPLSRLTCDPGKEFEIAIQ